MIPRVSSVMLPGALVLVALAADSGGWATITVEDLPEYVVARAPAGLAFTVRQHGRQPMNSLSPVVEARAGKLRTSGAAVRGASPGEYVVALNLPEPGDWTVTINSGFGPVGAGSITLLPIEATEAGALAPPAFTPAERGHRLFVAKGCVTCHMHGSAKGSGTVRVGPELTQLRYPADYLTRFLEDPTIKPRSSGERMPNLGLKQSEIAALVAFLTVERKQADR